MNSSGEVTLLRVDLGLFLTQVDLSKDWICKSFPPKSSVPGACFWGNRESLELKTGSAKIAV